MTSKELNAIWYYYLSIESDLSNTSQYVEPDGQENVYSFEFAKILILACTEVESVFKAVCKEITGQQVQADIKEYKNIILSKYPRIIETEILINRLGRTIKPFDKWNKTRLSWWDAYQEIKHNRGSYFSNASYFNAVMALSALYVSIFYLAEITNISFDNYKSTYITSAYKNQHIVLKPEKKLPDFE